ncbi:hypothetical protein ABZ799_01290 [Nocardiopsis dassonvillei]|uniref:hypothetical protein n=1 Tax=Nocardiopsis dassonvillei TaxID=2014 RepID=UPI0033E5542A
MADLDEGTWDLDGYLMGDHLPVVVTRFEVPGADVRAGDLEVPGGDGRTFGYDYLGGRSLTFELSVNTADGPSAEAVWADLATRWRAAPTRLTPRAVVPLRWRRHGGSPVVVYGRPRQLDAVDEALLDRGRVDLTGTFETADDLFYDDTEQVVTLDLLPQIGEGLILPFTLPAVLTPLGDSDTTTLTNAGSGTAWPVITFSGPITNPGVEWVAHGTRVELITTLAYDQTATIDTRPWARTILRSDGASLAGSLRGPALDELAIPPGPTQVRFTGQDMTGSARATIRMRSAYTAPRGGSS